MGETCILEGINLRKWFPVRGQGACLKALDGVSLRVEKGQTLGIVGESGCGKSTLGRVLTRVHEPTGGTLLFHGRDVTSLRGRDLIPFRDRVKMIFQDPYDVLDPRMNVREIIEEPLLIRRVYPSRQGRTQRVLETMERVGLSEDYLDRYPHEFSGGQRQRIGIARSIVLNPELIICDEPVSALDVSIQAKIINLLKELQNSLNLSYIFISHDLGVVKHISTHVMVMYLGRVVEAAPKEDLFASPAHPYTRALLSAIPDFKDRTKQGAPLTGEIPSPINPPPGCRFHTRCPQAQGICTEQDPPARPLGNGGFCACHFC
ncbi:MAG: ATP-binding cassette domain-containing protein [Spirochaetaceae bacterium]|jgi:oligopeptide/dipeptide ABC transporter ATP-binding protein|nr:ATP-binding cassette domain-containing protein [Spirochaetaceae bacterium]